MAGPQAPIACCPVVSALTWGAGFALVCVLAFGGWVLLSPLAKQEQTGWLTPA